MSSVKIIITSNILFTLSLVEHPALPNELTATTLYLPFWPNSHNVRRADAICICDVVGVVGVDAVAIAGPCVQVMYN